MRVTIRTVQLPIADQQRLSKRPDCHWISSEGFTLELPANSNVVEKILAMLQTFAWNKHVKWGFVCTTAAVIKEIHIDQPVGQTHIGNVPIVSSIAQHDLQRDWSENYNSLQSQLGQYQQSNDLFCEYYARTFACPKLVKVTHSAHDIPMNIWTQFGSSKEHMFVPLSNSALLTAVSSECAANSMIGIEAYIADIRNMIKHDIQNFKLAATPQVETVMEYAEKYANTFSCVANRQYVQYLFSDDDCKLVREYKQLKGEIAKLVHSNDANLIDDLIKLQPSTPSVNLIICAYCIHRIMWAYQNNKLPDGHGDAFGIKKNFRALLTCWPQNKQFVVYDDLPSTVQQQLIGYAKRRNAFSEYMHSHYIHMQFDPNRQNLIRVYNLYKSLQTTISSVPITSSYTPQQLNEMIQQRIHDIDSKQIKGNSIEENKLISTVNTLNKYIQLELVK